MSEPPDVSLGAYVDEAPPSQAPAYHGTAARSHSDAEAQQGLDGDLYAALALSSAHGSPAHSPISARGGEEMSTAQHVMAMLPADIILPVRQAFRVTTAYVESLDRQCSEQAAHIFDVQESIQRQEERTIVRAAALEETLSSDLQMLQTRLEQAEARASEWANRAQEADERAEAADQRATALEARLAIEEVRSSNNFKTAMAQITRLTNRLNSLQCDAGQAPPQRRQFSYTPGTAYHSVQQTSPAAQAALSEFNLRALGGSAALRDSDERSHISMHSTRSLLRRTPAVALPPRPCSVRNVLLSSATATVRDTPARPAAPSLSLSLADPAQERVDSLFTLADPAQARAREGAKGSLKEEARAQLTGAVREARDPQLWAMTQTVQTRTDLTQQLAAERAELTTKTAAAEASLERERQLLREEREEVERSKREHELVLRQSNLEAQERVLATKRATMEAEQLALDLARSELAHSVVSRGGGDGSESVCGGGAGGDGDGSGDGSSSTAASTNLGGNGGRGAGATPAPVPAPAAAASSEWPGRPGDVPHGGWFDARGYAITRVAVQIKESDLPKTTIIGTSMVPLVNLRKMLPSLIRETADAARQRQRPMWPALITADDFGSNWFSSTVRAVINCIVNGSGENYLVKSLAGEAPEWQKEGETLKLSDQALLEWFFARIAKCLELRRPAELAADLVKWVVKPGLPLKDFVYEFSAASTAVLSADQNQDNFVLTALLEICRQQYSVTAAGWAHISADPRGHTTRNLLEILRGQAELAKYLAVAREDDQPVYPKDLQSYSKGTFASGGGVNSGQPSKQQQMTAAQKDAVRRAELAKKQECQISYIIHAIHSFESSTGPARTCFNCGSDQHVFARCDQPYNAANWTSAVDRLPWVAKFRPTSNEDFKRLCAKAQERAAAGESGRSALAVWETQQQRKGYGGRGRGGRGGRGDHH